MEEKKNSGVYLNNNYSSYGHNANTDFIIDTVVYDTCTVRRPRSAAALQDSRGVLTINAYRCTCVSLRDILQQNKNKDKC